MELNNVELSKLEELLNLQEEAIEESNCFFGCTCCSLEVDEDVLESALSEE